MRGKIDGEDISDFTVKVGEATLRSAEHADLELGKLLKAVSQQPTGDGFSRAGVSCDRSESDFTHEVFEPEDERVDARRYKQGLGRHIGGGSWQVCKDVRDTPHKCLTRAGFAPEFPRIAGVLNNGCLKCVGARTLLAGCHVDYDIPDFLSGFHVTIGLDDFVERIAPVDDRAVFARLDARL